MAKTSNNDPEEIRRQRQAIAQERETSRNRRIADKMAAIERDGLAKPNPPKPRTDRSRFPELPKFVQRAVSFISTAEKPVEFTPARELPKTPSPVPPSDPLQPPPQPPRSDGSNPLSSGPSRLLPPQDPPLSSGKALPATPVPLPPGGASQPPPQPPRSDGPASSGPTRQIPSQPPPLPSVRVREFPSQGPPVSSGPKLNLSPPAAPDVRKRSLWDLISPDQSPRAPDYGKSGHRLDFGMLGQAVGMMRGGLTGKLDSPGGGSPPQGHDEEHLRALQELTEAIKDLTEAMTSGGEEGGKSQKRKSMWGAISLDQNARKPDYGKSGKNIDLAGQALGILRRHL
jgi:hypothetical protein